MISTRTMLGAGALAVALTAASALPAAAAETSGALAGAARQATAHAYPGEAFSQWRPGYRGYGYRRGPRGGAVAAGVIGGLAVGALAGAAIAGSPGYYGPGFYGGPGYYGSSYYYGPGAPVAYGAGAPVGNVYGADPNWVSYCASKYRSFDPRTGTYLANDGYRYQCQ